MPSRVVRAEINSSESLSRVSLGADLFFRALITVVDDYGRNDARPAFLKAQCFPLRDEVDRDLIGEWLHELEGEGCVRVYEVDGRPYLELTGWEKHRGQGRRAETSRFPGPRKSEEPTEVRGSAEQSADPQCSPPVLRGTRDEKRGTSPVAPPGAPAEKPNGREARAGPEAQALAKLLKSELLEREPGARTPRTLDGWAQDMDRLIRLDKRKPEEIRETIRWLFRVNYDAEAPFDVRSARALRAKWDRIQRQRSRGSPGSKGRGNAPRCGECGKEAARITSGLCPACYDRASDQAAANVSSAIAGIGREMPS